MTHYQPPRGRARDGQPALLRIALVVGASNLTGPTDFGEIYAAAVRACEGAVDDEVETSLTFHLSPGTPAMAAIRVILAKTRFPAELIESSRQHGVRTALPAEVEAGRFREDLFYRLAVAVLRLPPLRERANDLALLIDRFLERVNREGERQPGHVHKKLSAGARNLLLSHPWPGNVRELQNTLRRAALWSSDETLTADDVREALLPVSPDRGETVLDRPLGNRLDLRALLANVARHCLERALEQSGGNKTEAARLVGLPSYRTFTNWMKRYGLTQ